MSWQKISICIYIIKQLIIIENVYFNNETVTFYLYN